MEFGCLEDLQNNLYCVFLSCHKFMIKCKGLKCHIGFSYSITEKPQKADQLRDLSESLKNKQTPKESLRK